MKKLVKTKFAIKENFGPGVGTVFAGRVKGDTQVFQILNLFQPKLFLFPYLFLSCDLAICVSKVVSCALFGHPHPPSPSPPPSHVKPRRCTGKNQKLVCFGKMSGGLSTISACRSCDKRIKLKTPRIIGINFGWRDLRNLRTPGPL